MTDCIFCKINKGKIKSEKIHENDNFFSIYDANPVTPGHALVIPKKHFKTTLDLPSSTGQELLDCIKKTFFTISKKFNAEGFNIVQSNNEVAQQEVLHVHFHIVPRKKDDGLKYRWK